MRNRLTDLGIRGAAVDVDLGRRLMYMRLPGGQVPSDSVMRSMLPSGELRFRQVLGVLPYGGPPSTTPGQTPSSCQNGALVTPSGQEAADKQVILTDPKKSFCYVLGPTLLTGRDIGSADAVMDPTTSQWAVTAEFDNDDFVNKVAKPYVNQDVAIELDGVVQSAPRINPGITGRDVQITGTFTEDQARALAIALRTGALPVHLEFVSAAAAP